MSKGFRKPLTLLKATKTSCHRMWMTAGDRVWEMVLLPSCPISSPRVTVCGDKWTGCLYDTRSSSRTRAAEFLQDHSQMSLFNVTHFFHEHVSEEFSIQIGIRAGSSRRTTPHANPQR